MFKLAFLSHCDFITSLCFCHQSNVQHAALTTLTRNYISV